MVAGLDKQGDELYCPTCEHTFARGERCPNDNTRLVRIVGARDELIGRELDGRYTITKQLGAGGMGAVYRGTQHQLGREVAIKVVTPSLVKEPLVIKRFLREAKLASRLSHPNAVSVVDFGQTEDGLFFLVMELVEGRTLEDIVVQDGKLNPARVVRVGTQICDALEGAHALQIIHRDLKPQNVMVMATGRDLVKVLDFGLAKSLSPEQGKTTMTNAGALLGTPAFMPPELVLGQDCDARSDLYSLGCILYVCASGRLPFASSSVHEMIAMHASEPVKRIDSIPARLWLVLETLLAKDPDNRYQSATETREALEAALVDDPDSEAGIGTMVLSGPATVLGWDSRNPGTASAPRRSTPAAGVHARIATPISVPKVSVVPSSITADEADLIAGSATLPSDAIAAELAAYSELAQHASRASTNQATEIKTLTSSAPTSLPPAALPVRRGIGWKAIAAVVAAALAAAAVAFVIVEKTTASSSSTTAPVAAPAAPTSPAATSTGATGASSSGATGASTGASTSASTSGATGVSNGGVAGASTSGATGVSNGGVAGASTSGATGASTTKATSASNGGAAGASTTKATSASNSRAAGASTTGATGASTSGATGVSNGGAAGASTGGATGASTGGAAGASTTGAPTAKAEPTAKTVKRSRSTKPASTTKPEPKKPAPADAAPTLRRPVKTNPGVM